jgi:hypothetical protein
VPGFRHRAFDVAEPMRRREFLAGALAAMFAPPDEVRRVYSFPSRPAIWQPPVFTYVMRSYPELVAYRFTIRMPLPPDFVVRGRVTT